MVDRGIEGEYGVCVARLSGMWQVALGLELIKYIVGKMIVAGQHDVLVLYVQLIGSHSVVSYKRG